MNRNLLSRIRRAGETTSEARLGTKPAISWHTRIGLLFGGAVIIAGSAVPAIAASGKSPSAASTKPAVTAGKHTTAKPVRGAKPAVRATAPALASPASASLSDSACPVSGTIRSCHLWALPGTVTVPGIATPLPIWGFSLNAAGPATLPGPTLVAIEGETLQVTLTNSLPSGGSTIYLEIPESAATPDPIGVPETQTRLLPDFTGLTPGTYVYEAGPAAAGATANSQRQVAMGLAGMLVIRPKNWSATCHNAYDESIASACDGTPFDAESPVQLNELSTVFNNATAVNPTSSDLHDYRPDVFLVNGQSFNSASPTTGSIPVDAGSRVLLRYANLGLREHSMSIGSGVSDPLTMVPTGGQRELAADANLLKVQPDLAAIYLNPVQTADTLTQVDTSLVPDTLVPIYDQGQHLDHWTVGQEAPAEGGGIGGMITMLHVVNNPNVVAPDGPKTVVTVTPKVNDLNASNPADTMSVSATITSPSNSGITQAEWFLDSLGADGSGTPITSTCAPNWCFSILPSDLAPLLGTGLSRDGQHIIWVNGEDANLKWGAGGDTFSVDLTGPLISHTSIHSTPTNGNRANDLDGTNALDIIGTASASLNGWVVTAAEACVDSPCSTTLQSNQSYDQPPPSQTACVATTAPPAQACYGPFSTNTYWLPLVNANTTGTNDPAAPIVGFSGAIDPTTLPSRTPGTHTFYIHACEAPTLPADPNAVTSQNCGRWGDTAGSITVETFVIDTTAPATTINAVDPDPNNGFTPSAGNVAYLNEERVTATFDDNGAGNQGSSIVMGEVFITQPGILPWCYTRPNLTPAELTAAQNCSSSTPTAPAGFYGTGAEMVPVGGKWKQSATQQADAFIPLTDVRSFPEGRVWFWVHGQDSAGNWSDFTDASGHPVAANYHELTLDKTPPIVDSASAVKNANHTTDLTINAHDPMSNGVRTNIAQAEYFTSPCTGVPELETCFNDPGPGNGTAIAVPTPGITVTLTANIPNPANGQALYLRVKDAAGNWSIVDYKHPVVTYP